MNALIGILCLAFATAYAAPSLVAVAPVVAPVAVGSISQGPGSKTLVAGPDGSVISSAAEGGVVSSDAVASAKVVAPATVAVVQGPVANSVPAAVAVAPAAVAVAPSVVGVAPSVVGVAPAVVGVAPVAESTVVAGPSGTIATTKNAVVAAPAPVPVPLVVSHGLVAAPQLVAVGHGW